MKSTLELTEDMLEQIARRAGLIAAKDAKDSYRFYTPELVLKTAISMTWPGGTVIFVDGKSPQVKFDSIADLKILLNEHFKEDMQQRAR